MTDDDARRRRKLTLSEDDRGISDAIGFVLVFAIITASIAIFYATGYEELRDTRDQERTNNAQRAFDVLRSNMQDIEKRGAPSRATEIKLADARLYVGETQWFNVSVQYHANGSQVNGTAGVGRIPYQPIIYETDERSGVAYGNGAVFRQSDSVDWAMVQEPEYVFDDDRVLMTIMQTQGRSPSVAGSDTVLVRALREQISTVYNLDSVSYDVTIEMTTDRAGAWERYFESQGLNCPDFGGDDELSCTAEDVQLVQTLKVRSTIVFES